MEVGFESEKGSSSNKISDERRAERVGSELGDRPKSSSYEYALQEASVNSAKTTFASIQNHVCISTARHQHPKVSFGQDS